jgi:adenosylcobinamide kinase/adenosylcobinamide-phosphate guanylyltransferase
LLLLDCLGTLVGMVMAEEWPSAEQGHELVDAGSDLPAGYAETVESRAGEIVSALLGRTGDTIVVTNEVGEGVVPPFASGRLFRDVLGRANRALVTLADSSYLVVCGRLLELSALSASPAWPED